MGAGHGKFMLAKILHTHQKQAASTQKFAYLSVSHISGKRKAMPSR